MEKTRITIILGTARKNRSSFQVAEYIYAYLQKKEEIKAVLADVKDYSTGMTIPPWEDNIITDSWKSLVKETDAFIIVVPEYNHSFPGELKIVLDFDLKGYLNKPIFMAGVSSGNFGGTRAVQSLLPILSKLGLKVVPNPLFFPQVDDLFSQDIKEIDKIYSEKIEESLSELLKGIKK